jgi:hypothetical protein
MALFKNRRSRTPMGGGTAADVYTIVRTIATFGAPPRTT